jgi:hypothetical protein
VEGPPWSLTHTLRGATILSGPTVCVWSESKDMTEEKQTYSPREFLDKLQRDDLSPPLRFTGMAKQVEDDDTAILFAPGRNCANWVTIPLGVIENVEVVEIVPCKDHTHPLVNIQFKKPASEEALMFSSLARSLNQLTGSSPPIPRSSVPIPYWGSRHRPISTLDVILGPEPVAVSPYERPFSGDPCLDCIFACVAAGGYSHTCRHECSRAGFCSVVV